MEENIYGNYAPAMEHLKDVAENGRARRENDRRAVNRLLELSGQARQESSENDPLVREMMKGLNDDR